MFEDYHLFYDQLTMVPSINKMDICVIRANFYHIGMAETLRGAEEAMMDKNISVFAELEYLWGESHLIFNKFC